MAKLAGHFLLPWAKGSGVAYRMIGSQSFVVVPSALSKDFSSKNIERIWMEFYMQSQSKGEKKIYPNDSGHMAKMTAMPIYSENFQKSSSAEPVGRYAWKLVCSIKSLSIIKFAKNMILRWPGPVYSKVNFGKNLQKHSSPK